MRMVAAAVVVTVSLAKHGYSHCNAQRGLDPKLPMGLHM